MRATIIALLLLTSISSALEAVQYATNVVMTALSRATNATLAKRLFGAVQAQPISFFAKTSPGELLGRLTTDVDAITSMLTATVVPIVHAVLVLAFSIAMMFILNWRLAVAALGFLPVWLVLLQRTSGTARDARTEFIQALDVAKLLVAERLSFVGAVRSKTFRRAATDYTAFGSVSDRARKRAIDIVARVGLSSLILSLSGAILGELLVVGTGAWLVVHRLTTPGVLVSTLILQAQILGPISLLANMRVSVAMNEFILDRAFKTLDSRVALAEGADVVHAELPLRAANIIVRTDTVLVESGPFSIEPGEWVGLMGPSGSGKSSFALAISGFLPFEGHADLAGVPVTASRLRSIATLVLQHDSLFTGSVRDNLVYAADVDDAVLWEVLAMVELASVVRAKAKALDTEVGPAGSDWSGGERQRLALARAILRNPALLILDEATSAMDVALEQHILRQVRRAYGCAALVISHRNDHMTVLDRVVEVGPDGRFIAAPGSRYGDGAQRPEGQSDAVLQNRTTAWG